MATLHATLTADSANNIIVGNKNIDDSLVIKYSCIRGPLAEAGTITVINDTDFPEPAKVSVFDDCGLSGEANPLSMDYSGDNIRLIITVDDSSVDDVIFNYNIQKIKK